MACNGRLDTILRIWEDGGKGFLVDLVKGLEWGDVGELKDIRAV